jgi:hypothetical protein
LHASTLIINHPKTGEKLVLNAEILDEFKRTMNFLNLNFPAMVSD